MGYTVDGKYYGCPTAAGDEPPPYNGNGPNVENGGGVDG